MKSKRYVFSMALIISLVSLALVAVFAMIWKSRAPKSIPGYYTYQFRRSVIITNKSSHQVKIELGLDKEKPDETFILGPTEKKSFKVKAGIYPIYIWRTERKTNPQWGLGTAFEVEGDILTKWFLKKGGVIHDMLYLSPATVEQIHLKGKIYYFKLEEVWLREPFFEDMAEITYGESLSESDNSYKGETTEITLNGESYYLEFREIIRRNDCETPVRIDIVEYFQISDDSILDLKIH